MGKELNDETFDAVVAVIARGRLSRGVQLTQTEDICLERDDEREKLRKYGKNRFRDGY